MKTRLEGAGKLSEWIKSLPRGMKIAGMRAVAVWYGGREGEGLRKEPPTTFHSRANAYGSTGATFENGNPVPDGYFSAKQFRFVAAITEGFTKRYTRTHDLSNAWQYKESNSDWSSVAFTNDAPGAVWAYEDGGQARQLKNVGWREKTKIILASMTGALRFAQQEVNALLARKGK